VNICTNDKKTFHSQRQITYNPQMALQDIIQQMNSGGPEAPVETPPEPVQTPAAVVPPVEPAKPVETPTEPVAANPLDNTTAPAEPSNVAQPATPDADLDIPTEKFYGHLSKMTGGTIKSEEEFAGLINHYNELLEQAEQGFQPKFKDERAKLVYQILAENEGREPEAAMRTLRAINFNPEGKSVKDVLFEAYLLDPRNADLGPIEAQRYFEAEYDEKYSDVEGNPIKERQQALAVRDAKEAISKIKDNFKATDEPVRVISEEVEGAISSAVDKFGGIKLAFTDNPQESDYFTMTVEQQELQALKQDALNPQEWWANFLGGFETDKGFDYPSFIREFHEMRNHHKKAELAHKNGFKLGQLAKINEARNASDPKNIDQAQPAVASGKQSLYDVWANAGKG
jgi:hypothetical protein